jgi:hypothetical protein
MPPQLADGSDAGRRLAGTHRQSEQQALAIEDPLDRLGLVRP